MVWKTFFSSYVLTRWVISYLYNQLWDVPRPVHVIFCMVDHFEPGTGNVPVEVEMDRMEMLLREFPGIADNHRDHSGSCPKRTWFFPPHYHRNSNMKKLVSLCERGYGEIELHLHHGKTKPDTAANLEKTIHQCIKDYSLFGIFGTENGRKKFGFIHGDWALNNSCGGRYCGVNNETQILLETGCYADFTFPSKGESNPLLINAIFYAYDNPGRPKSHRTGIPVRASGNENGGLMMIQGPVFPFFKDNTLSGLRVFGDAISRNPVSERMIDSWVRTGIHVKGKPNWIFVKTHTHGAADYKTVLGKDMDSICRYLEKRYNDGSEYVLHYVTAREMYNIVKAVEAGEAGDDPEAYRDYRISAPLYDSSPACEEASWELKQLVSATYPYDGQKIPGIPLSA